MDPNRVAFLAAGWSLASQDAHGTSIALQDADRTVLVDAGGGVAKGLVRVDGLRTLDRVYLTHEHPDHTWGLPGLLHCLRFTDRERPLALAGPASALERARASLDALDVTCPFELTWQPIDPEEGEDELASWAPLDHSVETLGYRIGDVTVLGDTRPCQASVDLATGGSLLVHEASHTDEELCHETGHATPADAGRIASEADVDTLAVIHIHPTLRREEAVDAAGFPDTIAPVDGTLIEREGRTWREKPST